MIRMDGIVVDYNCQSLKGVILVVKDGDFEAAIKYYEKNRLTNLHGRLFYFKHKQIIKRNKHIFNIARNQKDNRIVIGLMANFDIDGNSKKHRITVRANKDKKFQITPLYYYKKYYYKEKDNDRVAIRIRRMNQKVKSNLFNPWIIPFRN